MNFRNFRDLKITTKLTISAAAFLLPLGIMIFSIMSFSLDSMRKHRNELNGIEVLRPAILLMQVIPQYARLSIDLAPGDKDYVKQQIVELLGELGGKYELYFGNEVSSVSPGILAENWNFLSNNKTRDNALYAYRQLMQDLRALIVFTGDISGLITDSEIESAYLVAAAVHELPQAQERMILIGNLLRTAQDGAFTQRRREELHRHLELLVYSDNARIQNRFHSAETLRIRNAETLENFEVLLKTCYDKISYFAVAVERAINAPAIDIDILVELYETSGEANNATYSLQEASFDRMETLITKRFNLYRLRLILALTAAALSTLAAFFIILITTLNIHKSTATLGVVFKKLDENDLSVKMEGLSNDELGEFMSALNGFLEKLQNAFASFNRNASMVSTAVLELSSSAKEITATANEQSASVAEIVSTMENNKDLSAQAAEKTVEVAQLAIETQKLSRHGAALRDANEDMMFDIRSQNAKIIEIIKNLADMLFRIDESIQLIDTIADHTKLIAFNAALEASSSGEAGVRFSVVAGEIRRFADNVVESAAEIKEKISELQEASQSLITEANNGSRAIDSGYNRMVEQKEVFENIVDVSQNVAMRSQQISGLSKQQETAFAHIFSALKEISVGINQFVSTTSLTSATAEKLNIMSIELKETLAKYHTTTGAANDKQ